MKPIRQATSKVDAESKALDRAVPSGGAVPSGRAVPSGGAVDDAVRDAVQDGVTK